MAISAARLGGAPVTIDWSNFVRISPPAPLPLLAPANTFSSLVSPSSLYQLPSNPQLSQREEIERIAAKLQPSNGWTDCIWIVNGTTEHAVRALLGISPVRMHFCDFASDRDRQLLAGLNAETTFAIAADDASDSFRFLGNLLPVLEWLGRDRWKNQLIAVADPVRGDLRALAAQLGNPSLALVPDLSGAQTIFSASALLALTISGRSVEEYLSGAKQVRDYFEKALPEKNALVVLAQLFAQHSAKRPIHAWLPCRRELNDWTRWLASSEIQSLDRDSKAFAPFSLPSEIDPAVALRLLASDDRITGFIGVDPPRDEKVLPRFPDTNAVRLFSHSILPGRTPSQLKSAEEQALALALSKKGRPHFRVQLDRFDARALGAVSFAFCLVTRLMAHFLQLNLGTQAEDEVRDLIRQTLQETPLPENADSDQSAVARLRGFPRNFD